MKNKENQWRIVNITDLTLFDVKKSINLLAEGKIAAIKISNVYSPGEVKRIVKNIQSQGIKWYPNFEFKQGRIGISATEYCSKPNGKKLYLSLEEENSIIRNTIFNNSFDPIQKMTSLFSSGFETSIARESSLGNAKYFTGLIRAMGSESTTHFDYAPHQLPKWWVSTTQVQFAVVIYLQMPGSGGDLKIYKRKWEDSDEKYNRDIVEKGPHGFEENFLEKTPSIKIHPREGEMVIFNSRHFHKVEANNSRKIRFSINSFMSLKDGKLYLWN